MSLLTNTAATANGQPLDGAPRSPGLYDVETALDDNRTARFTLSLPESHPAGGLRPLIVVLHYAGQPTRFYGRPLIEELFEPAWRSLGAIFVAPEAIDGQWTSPTNESFVLKLVETLQQTYAIDNTRTIVAGYSMGAIGSWHFVTHYPDRFVAAVPVAGFPRGEVECRVPVYALATESDEIFDYARLRDEIDALKTAGCAVEFATVAARGHYDVNGFGPALREVVPWLNEVFQATSERGDP